MLVVCLGCVDKLIMDTGGVPGFEAGSGRGKGLELELAFHSDYNRLKRIIVRRLKFLPQGKFNF